MVTAGATSTRCGARGHRRDARGGQRAAGGGELIGREIGPAGALAPAADRPPLPRLRLQRPWSTCSRRPGRSSWTSGWRAAAAAPTGPTTFLAAATEAGMAALGWDDGHHLLQVADVPAALTHAIAALDQR